MGQCEKILDNGEQCSNRAVPGTKFCKTHARISFRPVKDAVTESTPQKGKKKADPSKSKLSAPSQPDVSDPEQKAVPSPAGGKPLFPGLRPDERNILVAPQGLILLDPLEKETPDSRFGRLVRAMGLLSQAMALPGQVKLMYQKKTGSVLIFLRPAEENGTSLSFVYDAASSAARLAGTGLYIGQDNAFIRYRDYRAPRGYDAPDFRTSSAKENLLLVDSQGLRTLTPADFTEISLAAFCLQVRPGPHIPGPRPESLYALTPPPLYPMLSRYFRDHHLCFRLARVQEKNRELILFEIRARADAPTGHTVPRFVIDYLSRFPGVALLTRQTDERQVLLQWAHRYPLHIAHIAKAFDPSDMVLLIADHYPDLRIRPAPVFFDGDRLTENSLPGPPPLKADPRPADNTPRLKMPVVLRPDNGPSPPVAALILSRQEMNWTGRLLYHASEEAFAAYSLCQGEEFSVLLGNHRPIEGLPFGEPLRRIGDTRLFIPLRSRLWPRLTREILAQALEIRNNTYTFLMYDYRLDLSASAFTPLSKAVVADPHSAPVTFDFRVPGSLPELSWRPPESASAEAAFEPEKEETGITSKLKKLFTDETRHKTREKNRTRTETREKTDKENSTISLENQAKVREEAKDFLGAALCYSILKDRVRSARCFRQASELPDPGFPEICPHSPPDQGKTEE